MRQASRRALSVEAERDALTRGQLLGQVYVERYFSIEDKEKLQNMIGEVLSLPRCPTPHTPCTDEPSNGA